MPDCSERILFGKELLVRSIGFTTMPDHPNDEFLNDLCIQIIESELRC